MKRNIIILSFLTGLSLSMVAQTKVTEFNPGVAANGVNYALPRTVLKDNASATKMVYTPGEYAKYAERYLHISGVSTEPSTTWQLQQLNVYQEGEPDTTKLFTVNTSAKVEEQPSTATRTTRHQMNARQYLTGDILSATSVAKRAELTAQEILDIRESKNEIKRGEVESMPKDGASLKIVLDELDVQERALTQLFVGYTDTTFTEKTFSVTPAADINRQVFFRFSQKLGFVDADDLAGDPYYLTVKDQRSVTLPDEKELAKRKIDGLVYNMPSMAEVKIENLQGTVYNRSWPFAQFGTIDMLAPTLFNKGTTTRLTLYPATGAILHLEQ